MPNIPPYSETPPTEPGWYWRREMAHEVVMQIGKHVKPIHWLERRARAIDHADGTDEKNKLLALPDSAWKVEWAGPIPKPPAKNYAIY